MAKTVGGMFTLIMPKMFAAERTEWHVCENATVDALMKRGYLYLEDHDWKMQRLFDDSLDVDPKRTSVYRYVIIRITYRT